MAEETGSEKKGGGSKIKESTAASQRGFGAAAWKVTDSPF